LEGTIPGTMLIADVYAEIMQMIIYNLQPTVNIQRAKVTNIRMSIQQFLKQK
jgi:hypothetical protein